ncbi:MAG TPA: hypothetical protein VHB79_31120 [Polyangiaceae bacterium]|nr:hypothetical protein [Polyangiaceae bacterium]
MPRVRDELAVGRVVDGLDADDLRFECSVSLGQEPQKLQLCMRWSDQQDGVRVAKNGGNVLEEMRVVARALTVGAGAFGVSMKVVFGGDDGLGLQLLCVDAKDARFMVIEPNDRMTSVHARPRAIGAPTLVAENCRQIVATARNLAHHLRASRA